MKKTFALTLFVFVSIFSFAQSDQELNRDSVVGWQYIINPIKANAVYKPVKSQYANGAIYSTWQQKASDMLISWIQQSYLPRGLAMRTIKKNDGRWYLGTNEPLQSYGVHILGYETHFVNGKIDLNCCEQGERLNVDFNKFPGTYITDFNPGGLYFLSEQAAFASGDDDAQLSKEGIDKKIQSNLYNYRTYLEHYHNRGKEIFKVGIVVPKNGNWPFKPVLVKDAVAYIQQQMAAYPGIMQKNPYSADIVKQALDRLKPYYNEVVKIKGNYRNDLSIKDDNGHSLLNPEAIINGQPVDKAYPQYSILVTTTKQTIDQTKTDNPLWVYFDFAAMNGDIEGNPSKFDTKFGTGIPHMVYSMLHNFNYDFVAKWLSQPDARKSMVYAPLHAPAKSTGNNFLAPVTISATAAAKNKDANSILYEDFDGYPTGTFSAKNWHTYGDHGGRVVNATLNTINGQNGKWISLPNGYTFYPDFKPPLPTAFTIGYDVYFGKDVSNKRVNFSFRLDTDDPNPRKSTPLDLSDLVSNGIDFSLAMSGEIESEKRYYLPGYEKDKRKIRIENLKENSAAHITVSVKGASLSISVNGKEVMHDDNALPAGKTFKRYGWYCSEPAMMLSNIDVKSATPVK